MRLVPLPWLAPVSLLSVALSLVWLGGARLHLCFDGLEPPVTLHHLADVGAHPDHHSPGQDHSGSDVEFVAGLRGAPKNGADALAISPSGAHASAGVWSRAFVRWANAPSGVRTTLRFRQPPLRAPPA
jgi:hypothetical protein